MKTEIVIYDSHYLYLECMYCFLEKNGYGEDYQFQRTVDFHEIGTLISDQTSILIMNIVGLGLSDTFDFVEDILKSFPGLKVIILSPNAELKVIKKFFDKGVKCFLTKNTDSNEFLNAMEKVNENKVYINEAAKTALFDFICHNQDVKESKNNYLEGLTNREKDVLILICEGLRTREIADQLFISTHTVESHRRNIMLKLNVNNSSKLVKYAIDNNLVN